MRRFGTDAPEFFCFQIGSSDDVYKIPLSASMCSKDVVAFNDIDGNFYRQMEWLRRFIGDVVDELTAADANAIVTEWLKASSDQGATAGESTALSD